MALETGGFRDAFYSSTDGLKLHARIYGDDKFGASPVVCLPGLTRNARDFHELALFLSRRAVPRRRVIAFDYRGRGLSDYDRDWKNYDVAVEARDILEGAIAFGVGHGLFIGTSRGGLIIHSLAVLRPTLLKAVVLNDVGPVLDGEGLAHIRSYLERAPKPKTMAEAIAIQRAAHGAAFPALTDADWVRFTGALYRQHRGRPILDFDGKLLKQVQKFDLDEPMPALWPQFQALGHVPVLAIRGENSKLLSPQTLAEMKKRHSACETVTVLGQGHPPLLETGDLPQTIAAFFQQVSETVAA